MHPGNPRPSRKPRALSALLTDVEGATAVEYGLIAALVTVGLIGALRNVREALFALPLGTLSEVFAAALS